MYLIDLPHASDVDRNVALQKAAARFDMMVKRSNFRRERESAGS